LQLKARSISITLFHFPDGEHQAIIAAHDNHQAKVLSEIPHVFAAQRWVAPSSYVAVRPRTEIVHHGGEYAACYWSDDTPEQLTYDFDVFGSRVRALGKLGFARDIVNTWGGKFHVLTARGRDGLELPTAAVPFAPLTSGMVLSIGEVIDLDRRDAYAAWLDRVYTPDALATPGVAAVYQLMPIARDDTSIVHLLFLDGADPLRTWADLNATAKRQIAEGRSFVELEAAYRHVYSGLYRQVAVGQSSFYA
jgi:hypothetical protein